MASPLAPRIHRRARPASCCAVASVWQEMFKRMERERHRRREERAQEEAKGWGRRLPPKPPPSTLLLEHTRALGIKDGTKLSKKLVKSSFQQKARVPCARARSVCAHECVCACVRVRACA